MFYKVIKNDKTIDALEYLHFVKYCPLRKRIVNSSQEEAQGILSSHRDVVWHLCGLRGFPVPGYDSVRVVEIEKEEYQNIKALNGRTPEEIIDEYTLALIEGGLL